MERREGRREGNRLEKEDCDSDAMLATPHMWECCPSSLRTGCT